MPRLPPQNPKCLLHFGLFLVVALAGAVLPAGAKAQGLPPRLSTATLSTQTPSPDRAVTLVGTFGKGETVQIPFNPADPKAAGVMVAMVERVQAEAWLRRTVGAIEVVGLCQDQSREIARTLGKTALQAALGGKTTLAWSRLVVAIRGSVDVEGPALMKFLAKGPYEPGTVVVGEDLSRDGAGCGTGPVAPRPRPKG